LKEIQKSYRKIKRKEKKICWLHKKLVNKKGQKNKDFFNSKNKKKGA
jgi:hypothetical protein